MRCIALSTVSLTFIIHSILQNLFKSSQQLGQLGDLAFDLVCLGSSKLSLWPCGKKPVPWWRQPADRRKL